MYLEHIWNEYFFFSRSLIPDPVLDALHVKKPSIGRRGNGHGRVGRPPGSLNKNPTSRVGRGGMSGKGGKGGKAGAKNGKVKRGPGPGPAPSTNTANVPFERQRFGNLRGKLIHSLSCIFLQYVAISFPLFRKLQFCNFPRAKNYLGFILRIDWDILLAR